MSISGYFSDFSFAEILRFLHSSRKTGYLKIKPITDDGLTVQPSHLFWFRNGELVAVQNQRASLSILLMKISQSPHALSQAMTNFAKKKLTEPIGTLLKQQGLVQPEELRVAFNRQVLQPVVHHFAIDNAWFKFELDSALPFEEMTGLSLSPIQAALNGLRRLRNWDALKSKLPDPSSRLKRVGKSVLPYELVSEEAYLWNIADEGHSIFDLSGKLGLPVEETQKLAFRLIVTGLVEEIPDARSTNAPALNDALGADAGQTALSSSFIGSLLGFLKQRA